MRSTKLNRPKLSIELLQRPHLIEKLEKSKHLPLILISAPAGYGKSILVSQWLEEQKDNYSWLSLDEGMSNSSLFLTYFAQALERCSSVESPKLKKLDQEYHFLSWETIIDLIINRISKLKEPTRLILDDYQLIKNPEIHQLIETIITENISNFQFVIITRWDPPFQLNELRLYQKMLELKMQDLRFDENEITELLMVQHIISVKQEEIKELFERTEGWILAIRMVLLAKSFPEAVSGKKESEFLTNDLDYLVDQISNNLEPDFFKQLQICSLFDQFNEDLIASVFTQVFKNSDRAGIFLAKLKDLNLFLIAIEDKGTWFRFHHLFGDILRRRLERNEPTIIKPLYIHISSWFAGKDLIDEAIKYAFKAENYNLACDLIVEHSTSKMENGHWWVVQRWLNSIPRQFRKANVDLLLTELLICEETWNIEDFSSILDTLKSIDIENSSDKNVSLYLFHLGYFLTYVKLEPKKAVTSIERSKELWYDESYMYGGRRELILASSRQMLGLTDLALKPLEAIQKRFEPSSKMHIRAIHAKVLVHLLSGNFESADNDARKLLFLVRDSNLLYAQGWGSYFRGNVAFQSYNNYKVINALKEAIAFEGVFNYRVYFDALAGLILFKTIVGDENASKKYLKKLKEKVGNLKDNRFKINYQSVKARIALLNGQGKQELAWAETNWVKQTVSSYLFLIDVPELTKIRIIVNHGSILEVEEALHVLAKVKAFLDHVHNKYHTIDIEFLKAMALLRIGRKEHANESIIKALLMAENRDTIRPVIEAFRVMPALFSEVEQSNVTRRVLARIGLKSSNIKSPHKSDSHTEELTIREHEVIRLIAKGLRNKEIADKLSISIVTVKSHLTNIYRKLEVPNRVSMLKKVRNLQVLL